MAEDIQKSCTTKVTSAILKVVLGLVLIVLGIWAVVGWWSSLVTVFKGCLGLLLILVGLITIAIAKE